MFREIKNFDCENERMKIRFSETNEDTITLLNELKNNLEESLASSCIKYFKVV